MSRSIGPALRHSWRTLASKPGGRWLFSRFLGLYVPYTGSIDARVESLQPGRCVATLRDRRRVRNHLHSVHAMALCNLAEMVTGLALLNSLPEGTRGILIGFSMDYLKKARGKLTAECTCAIPGTREEQDYQISGHIRDVQGDTVAVATARWRIGPERDCERHAAH